MEKTKKRGRILAVLMAIVTVFSIIPILGEATADAAIKTLYVSNSEAMRIINQRMIKPGGGTYYTPQMSRLKYWNTNDKKGICTWCAFTNLLNRRVALENTNPQSKFFSFETVTKKLSGSNNYTLVDNSTIYLGDKENFADRYNNNFDNGKTGSNKVTYRGRKAPFASDSVAEKKNQVVKLLNEHPEGIVVQYKKDSSRMHGIVISGYYYDKNGKLRFKVIDSVDVRDGNGTAGETDMAEAWIGRGYGNYSTNADTTINNIFTYLKYYVFLAKEPIDIDLSGFYGSGALPYGKGYNIPGNITSTYEIKSVEARVVDGASGQYDATARYYTGFTKNKQNLGGKPVQITIDGSKAVTEDPDEHYTIPHYIMNIKQTDINNYMYMGGLRKGNYYFEVKVTDVKGNTQTTRTAFSIR